MKDAIVTGATGFTGSHVVPLLKARGWRIRCLVRSSSAIDLLKNENIECISGDLNDTDSMRAAFENADTLINIASIGFGHAPKIVKAAMAAGIKRALFVGTTAIFTTLNAPSKAIRTAAEKVIADSGLSYTILRPTMIYGTSKDRNMCRLIRFINKWPLIPVFGKGEFLQQPIYVHDLAHGIVDAISTDRTAGKTYNVTGANALSFVQVIKTISKLLSRNVRLVHLPVKPVVAILNHMHNLGISVPIKGEQILRLNEDKAFDIDAARRDFNFRPMAFELGIRSQLKEMGMDISGTDPAVDRI